MFYIGCLFLLFSTEATFLWGRDTPECICRAAWSCHQNTVWVAPRGGILHQGEHFVPGIEHFVPCKTFFRYKTPCVMHFVPPKTFSWYQIGKFDSFGGKRGAFLPQILNSANTHRDTIQVLQRQEQELRTRIAKHLSGQVRAPGASLTLQHWTSVSDPGAPYRT